MRRKKREREEQAAELRGFRDALEMGRQSGARMAMPAHKRLAYQAGHDRGTRAVKRILALAKADR